jgi:hypothetical protein
MFILKKHGERGSSWQRVEDCQTGLVARTTGVDARERLEHRSTSDGGETKSIQHTRKAQIRELVTFPKWNDLKEIATARGGASRPSLSAEA